MSADAIVRPAGRLPAVPLRSLAALSAERRRFLLWVSCAAVVHALLILGIGNSAPRIMGERDGQPDGISVDLVDAADFLSRTAAPADPSPAGAASSAQPPPPQPDAARPAEPQEATARATEPDKPDAIALPGSPAKESGTAPATKQKSKPQTPPPPQPNLPLQLQMPDSAFAAPGRTAAATRPPGVTRSGENDEFGRGVIRALRQTMPPPTGALGRVSVRLFLTENGNLQDVRVISGSGDPLMDQSVVFAVRQASFPLPPTGASLADRTFLVTYVYR